MRNHFLVLFNSMQIVTYTYDNYHCLITATSVPLAKVSDTVHFQSL